MEDLADLNTTQSETIADLQRNLAKSYLKVEKQNTAMDKMVKEREKSDARILELSVEVEDMRAERTELQYETVETVDAKELKIEKMK